MKLDYAIEILKILNSHGFDAFIVGGYVRDFLLNIPSNDIDITSSANPEDVKKMFDTTIDNGSKYNSITIIYNNTPFEITTFRMDVNYIDHRHPVVEYTRDYHLDALRRDFTINSLYMDKDKNIIDIYNGRIDIINKIVRAIGNPSIRFEEDALRILRGFYLIAKLDFNFDKDTSLAIEAKAHLLNEISGFRILSELNKIISWNNNNKAFKLMEELHILKYIKGFNEGINFMIRNNLYINDIDIFYTVCYIYNNNLFDFYNVANDLKNNIKELAYLTSLNMTKYDMIEKNIDIIIKSNNVRKYLKKDVQDDKELISIYKEMPIHYQRELDIEVSDIINIIKKKAGPWINDIKRKVMESVIDKSIKNEKDEIIDFIRNGYNDGRF